MTSLMMLLKRKQQIEEHDSQVFGSMRGNGEMLAPLMEGPTPENFDHDGKREGKWGWVKEQLLAKTPSMSRALSRNLSNVPTDVYKRSDLRLLLGVLGAPLCPVAIPASDPLPVLSMGNSIAMDTSSAQYIIQQYICATGIAKLGNMQNSYAMGRVKMVASEFETATEVVRTRNAAKSAESGCFVLWQMAPSMWNLEMAVGGSKVHAGSDGKLVWRHTPWLGSHAAKGPVRPLRRALQGVDPRTVASVFGGARCIGEKQMKGGAGQQEEEEECFILKVAADATTLAWRSEGNAEIIRHVLCGYFSQKTGLLVHVEDSHLTRIQDAAGDSVFWETTIESTLENYRSVDGVMIAHSGKSNVTLFRFGEIAMSHTKTKLEEEWRIDEVAFNVPGLSSELFIPPSDIRAPVLLGEIRDLPREAKGRIKRSLGKSRVAALDKSQEDLDNIKWRVEV